MDKQANELESKETHESNEGPSNEQCHDTIDIVSISNNRYQHSFYVNRYL